MRIVDVQMVQQAVKKMAYESNIRLSTDVKERIEKAAVTEASPLGKELLGDLLENIRLADQKNIPICQDTGMAIVWLEVGQDVQWTGGYVIDAVNQGVREAYAEGFLRKSVVGDPLERINTGDNTPAIVHYELVPGEAVVVKFSPKGFGSENMSRLKMLKPSEGRQGVVDFVVETVALAGPNPCPPIVVGVGIGGSFEKAAVMAKKALFRPLDEPAEVAEVALLEQELLERINALGIGPQGLGGSTTALAVNVLCYPTHIAGLPVAVNISCHATRHMEVTL